jgi:hypothetical protein
VNVTVAVVARCDGGGEAKPMLAGQMSPLAALRGRRADEKIGSGRTRIRADTPRRLRACRFAGRSRADHERQIARRTPCSHAQRVARHAIRDDGQLVAERRRLARGSGPKLSEA